MTRATFYRIGRHIPAVLYEPNYAGDKAHIAILVMHSDADYLTFSMGEEMAKRGYRVLCANVGDKQNSLNQKLLDVGDVVRFLRGVPGVEGTVLMGHSGGGTLMSAYQSLAENGVSIFQGPEKMVKCPDSLVGLPAADGLMLLDANFGNGAMPLFSLDPAVLDEESGVKINPALDLFNPDNGFVPDGSIYSDAFIQRFFQGQRTRHNHLIEMALDRLKIIERNEGHYADDEPFIVPGMEQGFMNNKLYAQDIRLMSHTRGAWPLLHADGSTTQEIVHSVRKPANNKSLTASYNKGALRTTVRTFLTSYAVRTCEGYGYNEDAVFGIDWQSSYNCPPGNVQGVMAPLLVMGMTAGWEYLASETIYENAKSPDKTLVFVEGADHLFRTAVACEGHPGQFGNTLQTTYDFVDGWLSCGRFAP